MLDWLPRSCNVGSELIHIYQPYFTLICSLTNTHKCAHTFVPQSRVSPLQGCFKPPLCLPVPLHGGGTLQKSHQTALGLLWLALTNPDGPLGVILPGNCGISWQALLPRQVRTGRQLTMGLPPSWRFLVQRNPHIQAGTKPTSSPKSWSQADLWSTANEHP